MKILFVCKGNIGRSQMAQEYFASLAGPEHIAESAGTEVHDEGGQMLQDRPGAKNVLAVMREEGIDMSENTRQQITPALVSNADIVVSLIEFDALPAYVQENGRLLMWDIKDPFQQSLEVTRDTRNQIKNLVAELIASKSGLMA